MQVVLVTDTFAPDTGPAADAAGQVCDALLGAGHDVLVVTATSGKGSYRAAQVLRLRRTPNPAALVSRIEDLGTDLVLVLRPRSLGGAVLRGLADADTPVVVVDPNPLSPRIGTALSTSHAGARLLGMVGVHADFWAPGVRLDEYDPSLRSAELHDAWTKGRPHTVVGYAGPLGAATTKHVRRLARIAALDEIRLVVLGCGPGTPALKQAGARIVGECGGLELGRALASLDVFVQPRKSDQHLGVVRTALASGVPVVAFETAATAEIVTHGENGLLVPPGHGRDGLAEAVALLAADPTFRARLAGHARASVADRSWSDAVRELLEIGRGSDRGSDRAAQLTTAAR